ncbi:MAG: spore maturation protein [Ruminococcaceae bacterium]|nr:spore maturation protein [Oscillospiraceae bacterium]
MKSSADLFVVFVIFSAVLLSFIKNQNTFDDFKSGAIDGIKTAVKLLPTFIGIITAVNLLSASGFIDMLTFFIKPITDLLKIPAELITLIITKPISGSASTGILTEIFAVHGPDSDIGKMASVMAASTETTLYAVSVYLSENNYKNLRYTVPVAIFCDFLTVTLSILLINIGL